jgi:hypothetical protein
MKLFHKHQWVSIYYVRRSLTNRQEKDIRVIPVIEYSIKNSISPFIPWISVEVMYCGKCRKLKPIVKEA